MKNLTTSEQVAKILLELKAVTLNPKQPFKYSSGILSPVYIDNRILMSYPEERRLIRDFYVEALKSSGVEFDLIAATATAGIPHAAWVADKLNLPMVYVRGSAKDHGKGNQIEGIVKEGQKAVVIEDLISTGESSVTTAQAVRNAGGEVSHIFAIITYKMQKSEDNFKENGLTLISLTTFADVVKVAEELGQISKEEKEIILEWTNDTTGWGKKMGF